MLNCLGTLNSGQNLHFDFLRRALLEVIPGTYEFRKLAL